MIKSEAATTQVAGDPPRIMLMLEEDTSGQRGQSDCLAVSVPPQFPPTVRALMGISLLVMSSDDLYQPSFATNAFGNATVTNVAGHYYITGDHIEYKMDGEEGIYLSQWEQ